MQSKITDQRIIAVSQVVLKAAKETLGDKLEKVILYGSYARGDHDHESDIDFFILADVPQDEASIQREAVRNCIPNVDLEYDINVSLHVTGKEIFNKFMNTLPFYINIVKEGVILDG